MNMLDNLFADSMKQFNELMKEADRIVEKYGEKKEKKVSKTVASKRKSSYL